MIFNDCYFHTDCPGPDAKTSCWCSRVSREHAAGLDHDYWKLRALSMAVMEAVITVDGRHRICAWNPAAEIMFGYSASEVQGQEAFGLIAPGLDPRTLLARSRDNDAGSPRRLSIALLAKRSSGDRFPARMILSAFDQPAGDLLLVVRHQSQDDLAMQMLDESRQRYKELAQKYDDMAEASSQRQQRDEQLIWQLMHHDALTGLPNRLLIEERIAQAMVLARSCGRQVGILVLAIDHFKHISDTLGQGIGDYLLTTVAGRLTECLGPANSVARLDGEQFAMIMPDLEGTQEVEAMAQSLLETLKQPIAVRGRQLTLAGAIGIAVFPEDGTDVDSLIGNADSAMQQAKKEGGNSWQLYAAEYNACALERLALEEDLRLAVEHRQFEIHYQPQVDLATGNITGAEALIRWRHPRHGLVSPAHFIPLAEETGLIVPMGEWVLQSACAQLGEWQKTGARPLRMAVNLSARQFRQNNLASTVRRIVDQTGIRPDALELEITESMLMQNSQKVIATLVEFRQQGICLAIDDFGTGYSSLAYLKTFPINTLKMDRSFIQHLPENRNDAAIVQAIIALGHGLKLQVVAEGVETRDQLHMVRALNCDVVQGFFFSRPVPARDFEQLLDKHFR